jgi:hypothetical protein
MLITAFNCPSDGNNPSMALTIGTVTFTPGYTSYPNNIGTYASESGSAPGTVDGPAQYAGAMAPMSSVIRLASITDGTSNTVIFSEYVRGRGAGTLGDGRSKSMKTSSIPTRPPRHRRSQRGWPRSPPTARRQPGGRSIPRPEARSSRPTATKGELDRSGALTSASRSRYDRDDLL